MRRTIVTVLGRAFPAVAVAQDAPLEHVPSGTPFNEGDGIAFDELGEVKDCLPPEFWENREYFFHEGMEIMIGPPFRKYGAPDAFETATQRQGILLLDSCPKMALALATTDCGATQSC